MPLYIFFFFFFFFYENNISTKNPYFKESELTQMSVDFRHLKIFLISKMFSKWLYACVVFVLLHETIGSPENHRVQPGMFSKIRKWSQTRKYCQFRQQMARHYFGCMNIAVLSTGSGVTPMGSGWANPRAPGLRGHPQGALSL